MDYNKQLWYQYLPSKLQNLLAPTTSTTTQTPIQKTQANIDAYRQFFQNAENSGVLPKMTGLNWLGRLKQGFMFPASKILNAFSTISRMNAAVLSSRIKSAKTENITTPSQAALEATKQTFLGKNIVNDLKAAWSAVSQTGQYANQNYSATYKEAFPNTTFTKDFSFAQNTNDWPKGFNWIQKLGAGFAASPADLVGIVTDIVTDPLTYITGGVGKGAAIGSRLGKAMVTATGEEILPKGVMWALSKTGRKIAEEVVEKTLPRSMAYLEKSVGSIAGQTPEIASKLSMLKTIPKEVAESMLTKSIKETAIRQTVSKLSVEEASKLFDYGGMKFLGQTVIPGYKFGKIPTVLSNNKFVDSVLGVFYTGKGMPEEYRYVDKFVKSAMKNRNNQATKLFFDITTGINKEGRTKILKYGWLQNDIERYGQKLAESMNTPFKTQKKLFTRLNKFIDELDNVKLSDTERVAYERYTQELMPELAQQEKYWGVQADNLWQKYMPIRTISKDKESWWARAIAGPKEAAYELPKSLDYLQAQKLISEGKLTIGDLGENTLKRIFESTTRTGRSQLLAESRKFGSWFAQDGLTKITGKTAQQLPELKGWYLPENIIKPLVNTKNIFFGDEAFKTTLKAYDKLLTIWKRLALATPGYHLRNLFSDTWSGVMEYGLSFLDPRKWYDAVLLKETERGAGRETILHTQSFGGKELTAGNVADEFLNSGVMGAGQIYKEAATPIQALNKLGKISPLELSTRVGGYREDLGRIVAGLIEKEAGADRYVIAQNVKKVFLDYGDLTPTEQNVIRRFVMPFYTWNKKNTLRQFELMLTRTGKYSTIPKLMKFSEDISDVPEGYEEEKPDYFKEMLYFMTPLKSAKSGNQLVFNPNLPFQGLSMLSPTQWLSAANPFAKMIGDMTYGREQFTKKEIKDGDLIEAPAYFGFFKYLPQDTLQKIGMSKSKDGTKLYLSTKLDYALRQVPTMATLGRIMPTDESKASKKWYDLLSVVAGIKFTPYEKDMYKEIFLNKKLKNYQDIVRKLKELKYLPEDFGLDDIKKLMNK